MNISKAPRSVTIPCRVGRCLGHLRTLSLRRAEVLVRAGFKRGQWVDFEVDSLTIRAKVLRVSRIQPNGEHLVLLLLSPGSADKKNAMRNLIYDGTGFRGIEHGSASHSSAKHCHAQDSIFV